MHLKSRNGEVGNVFRHQNGYHWIMILQRAGGMITDAALCEGGFDTPVKFWHAERRPGVDGPQP